MSRAPNDAGEAEGFLKAVNPKIMEGKMNLVNQPAIPFQLQDASGQGHRLEDYKGSWLLMVFHRHLG